MTQLKNILLCADDFGLNSGVSQAIIQLLVMGRLSAVSCMVNMPDFNSQANYLLQLNKPVQKGLHFNLTEGYFLSEPDTSCFSLNELLIKAHLGLIKSSFIAQELNTQLDHYIYLMGSPPDFIDGHQHVHQFPKIRQVLLKVYEQRLRQNNTFIRSTYPGITLSPFQHKAQILAITGGKVLSSRLKQYNIPHNDYFSGVYDFSSDSNYRDLFREWLRLAHPDTLVMCHPGLNGLKTDRISDTRLLEFNYLASNEFVADCQEYNIKLFQT